MNTNALKRFAQQTRTLLLEQVATRLHLVLKTDSVELRERAEQVAALRTALLTTTAAELVDKVAYTWFNRLVALRYLDVNGYQPLGVRIVSPAEADETHPLPEVLQLAQQGIIDAELLPDQDRVMGLLRGAIPSQNVDNEVYRELLVGACNSLHTLFPFLFEPVQDHTELLLPSDLTTVYSVVYKVRNELLAEDCQQVEVLGWLYQFYIAERKEAVSAAKTKVKKEDIPAATQLFTPRWVVEYMVQNTVGKLWLQHNPDSGLRQHMPYFIDSASLQASDKLSFSGPEELTVLDPACGSGHLLIYAFELLAHIYEEEAYSKADIPGLILTHNLRGLEIDERASQLAGFALMMKARAYHNRAFRKALIPHITYLQPLSLRKEQAQSVLSQVGQQGSLELWHDLDALRLIDNIGSLLIPRTSLSELQKLKEVLASPVAVADMFHIDEREKLNRGLDTLIELSQQYSCVAANPPYMGAGNMNPELSAFVKKHFPNSKADLMACFMESSLKMLKSKGFLGMINQQSWMFLSSYSELRENIVKQVFVDTLLQLGTRTFPEISGERVQNAAFTLFKNVLTGGDGQYIRLVEFNSSNEKREQLLNVLKKPNNKILFQLNQDVFLEMPMNIFAYWLDENVRSIFTKNPKLGDVGKPRRAIQTGNSERFIRGWFEVAIESTNVRDIATKTKWQLFSNGGDSTKWFGNIDFVVLWENNGNAIKNSGKAIIPNEDLYFQEAVFWSKISSDSLSVRFLPEGVLCGDASPFLHMPKKYMYFSMALLNSGIGSSLLSIINPTLNVLTGSITEIPFVTEENRLSDVNELVKSCVEIKEAEYGLYDYNYNFSSSWLLKEGRNTALLADAVSNMSKYILNTNETVRLNEEQIELTLQGIYNWNNYSSSRNKGYIEGSDELSIIKNFISYGAGCLFGRYSLDKEGIILANQGESLNEYLLKINKAEDFVSVLPDKDNIIPLLEDEWFEDDMVAGFTHFLKVTFGERNLGKNIAFIEEVLGRTLRQYFTKDFYSDHINAYSKRPIYWQFSSPNRAFSVLIYLHRYTADTLNIALNRYLRPLQIKMQERIERLSHIQINSDSSSAERNRALKEQDRLERQLREIQAYERDVLLPVANARISLDLSDGVLVNYNKFGKAVREVAGLNDAKTKAKVRSFDWIDATQIR